MSVRMLSPVLARTALAAAVLATAACGGAPTAQPPAGSGAAADQGKYAVYGPLTGDERRTRLVTDAEAEGGLTLYTSNNDIDDLVQGFEKAYPKVKVTVFRANSETVLQRVLQETGARRTGNDVVDTNDFELTVLNKQGQLTTYDGPAKEGLRPETVREGWTVERYNAFVVSWNTKLVPPGSEPRTLQDLTDPAWKGKLSMEVGDWDWYLALHTYLTREKKMTSAQADELFAGLARNSKVAKGHTVQGELLAAGQFSVAMSAYQHTADKSAKKGAPVTWRPPIEPVILRPNGVGLMKDARHPASALLWVEWALSDGQELIANSQRIPTATSAPGFTDPIPAGTVVYQLPKDVLAQDNREWSEKYDRLLRGAPKVS